MPSDLFCRHLLILTLFPLLLTGCVLPHSSWMERLHLTAPAAFEQPVPSGRTVLTTAGERWWRLWNDPALDAYMDKVLAGNLDIAKAVERYRQFAAQAVIAGAVRSPQLNALGNARRAQTPGYIEDTTGGDYSFSASAAYEVDLWGRIAAGEQAATFAAQASKEDLRALYVTVTAQAVDTYFLAVEQQQQLDLNTRITTSYQDALEMVSLRYQSGLSPALDVYLAKQNLMGGKAKRPLYEHNLAVATHALSVLAGTFPEDKLPISRPSLDPDRNPLPAVIPAAVLQQRPDIRAEYLRLQARDQEIAAAIADRFPRINLMAALGRSGADSAFGYITGGFWNLIADLSAPVVDGGRRAAEVERRKAAFMEEIHTYRQKVIAAFKEVEDALSAIRTTRQRIDLLEQRLAAAEAGFRLAQERYTAGLDDYLTVLSSQVIRFDVESQLISARRELISARISLLRALGGTWMEADMNKKIQAAEARAR